MEEQGNLALVPPYRLLVDIWKDKSSGTLTLQREEEKKTFHLLAGRIIAIHSSDEDDEPRSLLRFKKHPAWLVIDSLKSDPTVDPFMPLVMLEGGLLTLEEILSLLKESAVRMVEGACSWIEGNYHFQSHTPRSILCIHADILPAVWKFISEHMGVEDMLRELGHRQMFMGPSLSRPSMTHIPLHSLQLQLLSDFSRGEKISRIIDQRTDTDERSILASIFYLFLVGLLEKREAIPILFPEEETNSPAPAAEKPIRFWRRLFTRG